MLMLALPSRASRGVCSGGSNRMGDGPLPLNLDEGSGDGASPAKVKVSATGQEQSFFESSRAAAKIEALRDFRQAGIPSSKYRC